MPKNRLPVCEAGARVYLRDGRFGVIVEAGPGGLQVQSLPGELSEWTASVTEVSASLPQLDLEMLLIVYRVRLQQTANPWRLHVLYEDGELRWVWETANDLPSFVPAGGAMDSAQRLCVMLIASSLLSVDQVRIFYRTLFAEDLPQELLTEVGKELVERTVQAIGRDWQPA